MSRTTMPEAWPLRLDGRVALSAGGGSAGPGWRIDGAASVTPVSGAATGITGQFV